MIVIPENGLLGDTLAVFPALQELCRRVDEPIYLHATNAQVMALMPPEFAFKELGDIQNGSTKQRVLKTHCVAAWHGYVHTHHMVQAHFAILGLPMPPKVPRANIVIADHAKEYDYVIAPWSRSDHSHNKQWFDDRWKQVFESLDGTIAILGSLDDPMPFHCDDRLFYEYGNALPSVAKLMLNARKAVVTIDNGISHLAFHAGVKNHILLYPQCLPSQWVADPNALAVVVKEPKDLGVSEVLDLIPK